MRLETSIANLQQALNVAPRPVAFVPTMGALHAGHISLVKAARERVGATGTVVVSVFVNPTQFNDPADLEKYPRSIEADAELLAKAGVDMIFAPSVAEVYPANLEAKIFDLAPLDTMMEGEHRPGHFAGVVQVVDRLFDIVKPEIAMFGEKDFQQLTIIRRMEAKRGTNIEIVGCPIVRDVDGLAMSSRNALLSAEERAAAPAIYKTLVAARTSTLSARNLERELAAKIDAVPHMTTEYIAVADPRTLQPVANPTGARLFVAVHCGNVRLIDNIQL